MIPWIAVRSSVMLRLPPLARHRAAQCVSGALKSAIAHHVISVLDVDVPRGTPRTLTEKSPCPVEWGRTWHVIVLSPGGQVQRIRVVGPGPPVFVNVAPVAVGGEGVAVIPFFATVARFSTSISSVTVFPIPTRDGVATGWSFRAFL